jgi:hypothetical protein
MFCVMRRHCYIDRSKRLTGVTRGVGLEEIFDFPLCGKRRPK